MQKFRPSHMLKCKLRRTALFLSLSAALGHVYYVCRLCRGSWSQSHLLFASHSRMCRYCVVLPFLPDALAVLPWRAERPWRRMQVRDSNLPEALRGFAQAAWRYFMRRGRAALQGD